MVLTVHLELFHAPVFLGTMTREELLSRRWGTLLCSAPQKPEQAVIRLGAVQAQDFGMALLAVGIRSAGSTSASVEAALSEGRILRTHVLRPTWHLAHRDDLRWLLALTAPEVTKTAGTQYRRWGLTPDVLGQSRRVLERALRDGPATREELNEALRSSGFPTGENRSTHHLMDAELNAVICSGPRRGKAVTYDLFDRRVPASAPVPRDEALPRLALRYIRGHGPATDRDFAWWSGLRLTDARRGLQASRPALTTGQYGEFGVWFDPEGPLADVRGFRWLPAYDEALVAFADRSAVLDAADKDTVLTGNGIFNPVIVHDGRVVGTWKRQEKAKSVTVEAAWFAAAPPDGEASKQEFTGWLRDFLGKG